MSVSLALTVTGLPEVVMTACWPTLAVACAPVVISASATAAAAANRPALIGVVETVALFVASVWTVNPLPPVTDPSHVAFVGASTSAVGTEAASPKPRLALPTSASALAVFVAFDSIVDVPATPLIEAPWAPLAVTCASPVMSAYETVPAREARPPKEAASVNAFA